MENTADPVDLQPTKKPYRDLGIEVGELVQEKNEAYGDSFGKTPAVLKIMYPQGIRPDQYDDVLTQIRVLDKQFRIATDKDALGESPWMDVAGYGLLGWSNDIKAKESSSNS